MNKKNPLVNPGERTNKLEALALNGGGGERKPVDASEIKNLKSLPAVVLPKVAEDASKEFGWSTTESVALAEQRQTAGYWNTDGDLVIRQRCWPDDDALIFIAADSVDRFIDKLTDVMGIPSAGKR